MSLGKVKLRTIVFTYLLLIAVALRYVLYVHQGSSWGETWEKLSPKTFPLLPFSSLWRSGFI